MNILRFLKNNLIACLLGVLLVASLAVNGWLLITRNPTVITDDAIREEVQPVAKLGTYEYQFTELMYLDKANNPLGWNNPITSTRYLATIDGTVDIGVDARKMKIESTRNPDQSLKAIAITLPHSKAENPNLDQHTLKKYVEDKGIFDLFKPGTDDLSQLLTVAEDNQLHKIEESNLLEASDNRVAQLLADFIHSSYGDEVEVTVSFDDSLAE